MAQPLLSTKERIALAIAQLVIGLFIIFVVGTILHYYIPVSGPYGVYIEGALLGMASVYCINKVVQTYKENEE